MSADGTSIVGAAGTLLYGPALAAGLLALWTVAVEAREDGRRVPPPAGSGRWLAYLFLTPLIGSAGLGGGLAGLGLLGSGRWIEGCSALLFGLPVVWWMARWHANAPPPETVRERQRRAADAALDELAEGAAVGPNPTVGGGRR